VWLALTVRVGADITRSTTLGRLCAPLSTLSRLTAAYGLRIGRTCARRKGRITARCSNWRKCCSPIRPSAAGCFTMRSTPHNVGHHESRFPSLGISGAAAVAIAGSIGKPVRSREERLVSLLGKNEAMTDLAVSMTAYPLTWGAMNTTYESAKGLMSTKASPEAKRKDHQVLIDKGWLTTDQSERFYKTAGYYRHGYPKTPIKHASPMEYAEASILIKTLFWQLVDAIEPT
jgi:hypothetical protein